MLAVVKKVSKRCQKGVKKVSKVIRNFITWISKVFLIYIKIMVSIATTFSLHTVIKVVGNLVKQLDLDNKSHELWAYYFFVNILFFTFFAGERARVRG